MNEIEKRIATVWPGRPTTADVEATRLADLRAIKAEIDAVLEKLDVQADITGQLGASFHTQCDRLTTQSQDMAALRKRIEELEGQFAEWRHVYNATRQPASPAPPAPLVERICLIFHKQQSPTYPDRCEMAKEALLVAAEELLGPVTSNEWAAAIAGHFSYQDCCSAILRARLARAKEAGL